jgi:hypothetical protein
MSWLDSINSAVSNIVGNGDIGKVIQGVAIDPMLGLAGALDQGKKLGLDQINLDPTKKANFTPQQASLQQPMTSQQVTDQYGNMQGGLKAQQDLIAALQGQGGLAAQQAAQQQLAQQGNQQSQAGMANQANVYNQLQGVANGTGPNPAQAMLNNATGQNVQNQAALMASQRGAGANVGLMARQAANQGANIQQQAAGQGAAMQAQQQLGAMNQLGNIANTQASQGLQGQMAGQQGAAQMAGNQIGATQGLMAGTQGAYGQTAGALQGQNAINAGMTHDTNIIGANQANFNAGQSNALTGMLLGAGAKFGTAMATGGASLAADAMDPNGGSQAPTTALGQQYRALAQGGSVNNLPHSNFGRIMNGHKPVYAQGGQVPALVSPGERYLSPKAVEQVEKGKDPMKAGEKIPGKPAVLGAKNSYANDTVKKTLQEGGIVLPRSVTQAPDKDAKARAFVAAVLAKKGKK